jgi:hypothetical protein
LYIFHITTSQAKKTYHLYRSNMYIFHAIFTLWSPRILYRHIVLWFLHKIYWNFMILQICDVHACCFKPFLNSVGHEFFWKLVIPIVPNLSSSHPSFCLLMFERFYIPKTFNKYSAWNVFDSRIIKTIHNFLGVWTTSTMMWELWLSNHHKFIGFMVLFQIHAKYVISWVCII